MAGGRRVEGAFDRVVSVEMVEAVGKEFLEVRVIRCLSLARANRSDGAFLGYARRTGQSLIGH